MGGNRLFNATANSEWFPILELLDTVHSLQHTSTIKNRPKLMAHRDTLRELFISKSGGIKGGKFTMGDTYDMWYSVCNPRYCTPVCPTTFGERVTKFECVACFHEKVPTRKSSRPWSSMRMDTPTYKIAVELGVISECSEYSGFVIWNALQGVPHAGTPQACSHCVGNAYQMHVEGKRGVILCTLEKGLGADDSNYKQVSFAEWESIIVGQEMVVYKAIADGRNVPGVHWTCAVDVDLKSCMKTDESSGTWFLMDDLNMESPSQFMQEGWVDYVATRSMVIYVRASSRPLTTLETTNETSRRKQMGTRLATLKTSNLLKLRGTETGDTKTNPMLTSP